MGLFSRQSRPQHEMLDSVIGPTANLTGTIRSDGGVRIEGYFEGLIEVAGNVVVVEGARVVADIAARNVTVGGAVKGNISGTGRLEILSTGQVVGDITVASVMIDDGGIFQGVSRMHGYEQRALAAPADESLDTGPVDVFVEEPSDDKVEMVELTARHAEPEPAQEEPATESARSAVEAPEPAADASAEAEAPAPKRRSSTRRRAADAPSADSDQPATDKSATKASAEAEDEPEIDFDSIEPVIPDIVVEEPASPPPKPRTRRRGRTQR